MPDLQCNSAIVTGASAGIGRETVRVLARDSVDVAVAVHREGRLKGPAEEIESEYGIDALIVPTD